MVSKREIHPQHPVTMDILATVHHIRTNHFE